MKKTIIMSSIFALQFVASAAIAATPSNSSNLDVVNMGLANTLFQNQSGITQALTAAGVTTATDFASGTEFDNSASGTEVHGYSFTVEDCVRAIPIPRCSNLGTLTISTTTQFTPGGPLSNTQVTFNANATN